MALSKRMIKHVKEFAELQRKEGGVLDPAIAVDAGIEAALEIGQADAARMFQDNRKEVEQILAGCWGLM